MESEGEVIDDNESPKYTKARALADQLAHLPDSPDQPEDVEQWEPETVYDWLESFWNYSWENGDWRYE